MPEKNRSPGALTNVTNFTKSLWTDPFRWQLVKSVGMFGLAIYFTNKIATAEALAAAEALAEGATSHL